MRKKIKNWKRRKMDKKEIASRFKPVRPVSKMAEQILKKRYYKEGEKAWEDVANRVVDDIASDWNEDDKEIIRQMIINRYMVPNSPCLVNAGNPNGGKLACFVVDFKDTIEDIYKTKLDFALIARKGGGCGTTLSKIRPEGAKVAGSTHGYAGGPVKFADTISHDMDALTQAGFRQMAMLFSMSVYHPDIIKFINAKAEEGRIENANLSVMVDDNFMRMVEQDKTYWTQFNGEKYNEYRARDIFDMIVEGMWRGGEPGLLFYDRINDSPYKYTGQIVETTNPCLDKDTLLWDGDRYVKISENPKTFKSWKTGEKETIKLYTNIGYQIILTPDHKIMLADGSFIEAKDSLGKEIMWKGDRGPELAVTISGIKPMGIREVWDFSNEVHYNTANGGFVVHNCGEEPMPPGGSCDLGSIDFSKFLTPEGEIDFDLLDIASRYTVRFLDSVLDKNSFPTEDSRIWAERNRAIGVGGMGYADLLLMMKIPYGSQEALDVLESIMKVMEFATEDESIKLGQEKGIPEECKKLPVPRRNIVLRTFAPTGTCSILAGCSNSLEPIFSEVTVRNDKTGTYTLVNNLAEQPYFRCAVSANGAQEVTVEEHIKTLALAQKYIDSGVSKTINAPTTIKRDAIAKAIFMAWQEGCKGITLYRNGSRKKEVLTPKNIKKGKCPVCGSDLIEINGKMKCLSCKKDFDMSGKEFSYN